MPTMPMMNNTMSLISLILAGPNLFGKDTQISMMAGKMRPNADRQSAPNKEMNRPNCGTDTANTTEKYKPLYYMICHQNDEFVLKMLDIYYHCVNINNKRLSCRLCVQTIEFTVLHNA